LGILPLPNQHLFLAPLQAVSINKTKGNYDQYMQDGYNANQKRNYEKAIESFHKALKEQPNDQYALQAIQNIKMSQLRNKNSSNNFLLYILGGMLTLGLILLLIPFLLNYKINKKIVRAENSFINEKSKINLIQEGLDSPKPIEVALEVQQTTRITNIDVIGKLVKDLQDIDSKKRRKAIWEIAQIGDSRAIKPLVHLMIEADSIERGMILESLSQISLRTLSPINQALAMAIQDQSPQVRKNAIRDLTHIYTLMSQVNQLISVCLEDPDSEVQETAKWAAKQLNLQSRSNILYEQIHDPSSLEDSKE